MKMTPAFRSALYEGRVTHRRLLPVEHALEYRVFSLFLDLDELPRLDATLRRFSRGKFNLYGFHDGDHGVGHPTDLAAHIRDAALKFGLDASGPLELLCYPRILGYVFNPIAVYFLHDQSGAPSAVLYEVSSTFGERHSYLIPVREEGPIFRQVADKCLHVSPFMEMDMRYYFRVQRPSEQAHILIRETRRDDDEQKTVLNAAFQGTRVELSDSALVSAFCRFPLMTLKVIAGIHVEAVRLLGKGMRLRAGDPAPETPITLVSPATVSQ